MTDEPRDLRVADLVARLRVVDLGALLAGLGAVFGAGYFLGGLPNTWEIGRDELESIIVAAFGRMRNEGVHWDDSERLIIVENVPEKHTVLVQLLEVPIPESVRVQFGESMAPAGQFELLQNIVLVAASGDPEAFKKRLSQGVSVSYVASPDQEGVLQFERRDQKVFASGRLLFDGSRTIWPEGGAGPFGEY